MVHVSACTTHWMASLPGDGAWMFTAKLGIHFWSGLDGGLDTLKSIWRVLRICHLWSLLCMLLDRAAAQSWHEQTVIAFMVKAQLSREEWLNAWIYCKVYPQFPNCWIFSSCPFQVRTITTAHLASSSGCGGYVSAANWRKIGISQIELQVCTYKLLLLLLFGYSHEMARRTIAIHIMGVPDYSSTVRQPQIDGCCAHG